MSVQPLTIDEPIPQVCKVKDVCRILRFSRAQLLELLAAGRLPLVELERYDAHRRFTGESVAKCKLSRHAAKDAPRRARERRTA